MRCVDVVENRTGSIVSINPDHVVAVYEWREVAYKAQVVLVGQINIFTQTTRAEVVRLLTE